MTRLRVKELAEEKGFNMTSLSREAKLNFITVKRIFRDPYVEVKKTTLEQIAKALDVQIGELFEDVPDKEE
ncbi:XRE family transcriptional regulator [Ktedonosporobacter rubrisoli]|uniref:XRE family transcriptional regulator n=1 Tax=Ktedonosporobacter rubrisoli TaxID=2509675 RepID=A0A4P6JHL0_KTERU|nr:helix-turn-helix transcriptional regulator [Ktedonosporobacter rubrisoli]QBD74505.1 XRE family transcriptional regulator [Ktedonosporobacter rubrisoli]